MVPSSDMPAGCSVRFDVLSVQGARLALHIKRPVSRRLPKTEASVEQTFCNWPDPVAGWLLNEWQLTMNEPWAGSAALLAFQAALANF